jgi:hypothetical protein
VLGYNPERQREILSRLGVPQPDWQTLSMMLFWSVAAVLLGIAVWLLRTVRHDDPVQRAWLRFCSKLRRAGVDRAAAEGPFDYAARAMARLPERKDVVRAIADLYVELRYGARVDTRAFARLKKLVQEFKT